MPTSDGVQIVDGGVVVRVADHAQFPGPRYRHQGPTSGEELRDDVLVPKLAEARAAGRGLVVDLRGMHFGYPVGYLEEAFGGLVRLIPDAADHLQVVDGGVTGGDADMVRSLMREAAGQ